MSPSIVLRLCDVTRGRPGCSSGDNKYQVRLIGGASGGPRIITATAQVILNYIALGKTILESVTSPRIHSQLYPPTVRCENRRLLDGSYVSIPEEVKEALLLRGQDVGEGEPLEGMGVSQFIAISVDPVLKTISDSGGNDGDGSPYNYELQAVSDPRKNGRPSGY